MTPQLKFKVHLFDKFMFSQEELKHFQIRIDKHNYWKTRQDKLGQELNEGHITEPMEHEQIVDKVKEHGRVVCFVKV